MSAPMNLVHYSSGPVGPLRLMLQARGGHNHFIGKPHGLWLSVEGNGDGWRDWCLSEGFGIEWLTHVHDVSLAEGANVLHIADEDALDEFTGTFSATDADLARIGVEHYSRYIEWADVALSFDGIIIAPYIWSRRLHEGTFWYHGWDCASGCIWHPRAITSVVLREIVPEPQKAANTVDGEPS